MEMITQIAQRIKKIIRLTQTRYSTAQIAQMIVMKFEKNSIKVYLLTSGNQSCSERSHFSVHEFKKNRSFVSQSLIGKMFPGKEKSISENKFIIYIHCFLNFYHYYVSHHEIIALRDFVYFKLRKLEVYIGYRKKNVDRLKNK